MGQILKKKKILLASILIILVTIFISQSLSTHAKYPEDPEDPSDDGDDFVKDLGYISIGLFVASGITIIIYFTNKYSRRFLKADGKNQETREWIIKNYTKIRKPLNYIHYLVGFGALTVLVIHGVYLSTRGETLVAIGWLTAAAYAFYILSGLIIWLKIKPFWNLKKAMKILIKLHKSFILFTGIVIIHIIHVIMAD